MPAYEYAAITRPEFARPATARSTIVSIAWSPMGIRRFIRRTGLIFSNDRESYGVDPKPNDSAL